uniref:LBH domain-containing protein n=1 Tax=Neogobius melanostomus TaxID=47308 RepID=A0A8C6S5F7_9GOBI
YYCCSYYPHNALKLGLSPFPLSQCYLQMRPTDFQYRRERLPSIVVEPTEQSEAESGELRWPPRSLSTDGDDDDSQLSESTVEGDCEDMDQG